MTLDHLIIKSACSLLEDVVSIPFNSIHIIMRITLPCLGGCRCRRRCLLAVFGETRSKCDQAAELPCDVCRNPAAAAAEAARVRIEIVFTSSSHKQADPMINHVWHTCQPLGFPLLFPHLPLSSNSFWHHWLGRRPADLEKNIAATDGWCRRCGEVTLRRVQAEAVHAERDASVANQVARRLREALDSGSGEGAFP